MKSYKLKYFIFILIIFTTSGIFPILNYSFTVNFQEDHIKNSNKNNKTKN